MRRVRQILRVLLWSVIAIVMVVGAAITGGLFYLRSDRGREFALALTLRKLQPLFPGGLKLGRSEGRLTDGLTFYDVELDDLERQPAIKVARLEIHYALLPLLARQISVRALAAEGILVVSRPLANGRDNLATMVQTEPKAPSPPLKELPISVDAARVDLQGRFVRLHAHESLAHPSRERDVRLVAHGEASLSRSMVLRVGELVIDLSHPVSGRVEVRGTLDFSGKVALRNAVARVDGDARVLRHYVDVLELRGPMRVDATANGHFDDLRGDVVVHAPHHGLRVAAGGVHLQKDRVRVHRLELDAPFARVRGKGTYVFDGDFDVDADATVSELDKLALFGVPGLAGRAHAEGHVQRARELTLQVKATADELVVPGLRMHSAAAEVASVGLLGDARLQARGVDAGGVGLQSLRLVAGATTKQIHATLDTEGGRETMAHLEVEGAPRVHDGRVTGGDAQLHAFRLVLGGNEWHQLHESRLAFDATKPAIDLQRVDLAGGDQRLSLAAKLHGRTIDDAFVELKHLDLERLAAVLSPGHALPFTDIYAIARAHGPLDDPTVDGRISGEAHGKTKSDLIHVSGGIGAHLASHRLAAKSFLTIGGQKVSAEVLMPLPLRPNAPIEATVDASVLLSPTFSELLVPKLIQFQPLVMFTLSGTVTAQVRLTGTTSNPLLHATARFANWEAGGAHGAFGLSTEYKAHTLSFSTKAELSSLRSGAGSGGGVIEATGSVPLDLAALLDGGGRRVVSRDGELHALVNLKHVGIDYLPLHAFNLTPPLQHGRVEGNAELAGSIAQPHLSVALTATGFDAPRVGMTGIDVKLAGSIADTTVSADATLSVRGSEAVHLHGNVDGGNERSFARTDWRRAALHIEAATPGFDLGELGLVTGLAGKLRGATELSGTLMAPIAIADYAIDALAIGDTRFQRFALKGKLEDGLLAGELHADQAGGATLAASAKVPLHGGALLGHLLAHGFVVDVRGDALPTVRTLRGMIDAELALSGTTGAPGIAGTLAVKDGELRVPALAADYHEIDASIAIDPKSVRVEHIRFLAGTRGDVQLSGRARLAGLVPTALDAKLVLHRFPLSQQGIGVLLDAEVDASGSRSRDGLLSGRIHVVRGGAELPPLAQTRVLLPTGGLADVRVVEHMPKGAAELEHGVGLRLGASLDGPFLIKGQEVSAIARGGLTVDLRTSDPVLRGTLRFDRGGWIALFGRKYELERGRVAFDGTAIPALDVRISRRTPSATIGVDVHGRADAPELAFWSSPPIYDTTQVVGIVLSGDPATSGVTPEGLQKQAVGAISSLLVTGIKQSMLPELPIDVFRLDANGASGGVEGAQIEVGKYLTDSLYVGYAYAVGAQRVGTRRGNQNEARLDYKLRRNWQVETSSGDAGAGGVDLYWTYRP